MESRVLEPLRAAPSHLYKRPKSLDPDLFSFAYIPAWYEQLHKLKLMARPEAWQYKMYDPNSQNTETPILERHIQQIFKKQSIEYMLSESQDEADQAFYIRNEIACLHTGLYTS